MRNIIFTIGLLTLVSCGPRRIEYVYGLDGKDGVKGEKGDKGDTGEAGQDGDNGHSLVSEYMAASALECEADGSRLDIYLDLDDSLSVSEGDLYNSSIVVCDGLNGVQGEPGTPGEQGPKGEAGPQGLAGTDGEDGEDGEDGQNGENGAQGAVGPQGAQGEAGPTGPVGPQGPQGTAGTNATASIVPSTSTCTLITGSYYTKNNVLYLENDTNLCDGNHDKVELNSIGTLWLSTNQLAVFDGDLLKIIAFN